MFSVSMQIYKMNGGLNFLRFSVSIALRRRLNFFVQRGLGIVLLEGVSKQVATKGPPIIRPDLFKSLPRYKVPFLLHARSLEG